MDVEFLSANERTAGFIDGANMYSAIRGLAFDIDYRTLLNYFRENTRLVRMFYYTALVEEEYSPIKPLVDWLSYNGYNMVTKPTKEFTDAMGRRKIKGNMDIELAIDMLELAPHLDHVVLFSGDGDFCRLVDAVKRRGVRVSVISTIRTSPPMISDDLRRQADQFVDLNDLKDRIARKQPTYTNEVQTPTPRVPPVPSDDEESENVLPRFVTQN